MEDNKIPKIYMTKAQEGVVVDDYFSDQEFCVYLLHALQSRPNSRYFIAKTIEFFDANNPKQNIIETKED